jgi:uncharacterized surface protein with fasciclin (FAS1) repeats
MPRRHRRGYLGQATEISDEFRSFLNENPAIASGLATIGGIVVNAMLQSKYGPAVAEFMKATESAKAKQTAAESGAAAGQQDIVDTAAAAGSFKTLAAALKAADLTDALKGKGPITVFAPTDAAFAELPEGTLKKLLKPENKAELTGILLYHVVPGRIAAADIKRSADPQTLQGAKLHVTARRSRVKVNRVRVMSADLAASNGIIHVIDEVLLPPAAEPG